MRSLDRWFRHQRKREERAVYLEDALLSDRFAPYAVYRLRLFLGRSILGTAIHLIELLFLFFIFSEYLFVSALLVRAGASLVSAWWWGATEVMREEIRELRRDKMTQRIPERASQWLSVSLIYALVTIAVVLTWVLLDSLRASQSFSVFHLFVLANGIRISATFIARTFHSGVYALRRVYRPFAAIVAADLSGFVGTLLLWPVFGRWSFPSMLIVSTILVNGLTIAFASRTYRIAGLLPDRPRLDRRTVATLKKTLGLEFQAAGLSTALMRLDSLLILVLFRGAQRFGAGYELFLIIYSISPLMRAASDWAYLFYFDLKRLDADLLTNFKRRFEQSVFRLSLVVGSICWLLSSVTATLVLGRNLGWLYLLFLPFFLLYSQLAVRQIGAFSSQRYRTVIASGAILVIGTVTTLLAVPDGSGRIGCMSLVLGVGLSWLVVQNWFRRARCEPRTMLPISQWLATLGKVDHPVRIRSAVMSRDTADGLVEQMRRAVCRELPPGSGLAYVGRRSMSWYEPAASRALSDKRILQLGAGLIERLQGTRVESSGRSALELAHKQGLIGHTKIESCAGSPSVRMEEVNEQFKRMFPTGVFHDLKGTLPEALRTLPTGDRRTILREAIRHACDPHHARGNSSFEVSTLCFNGEIRSIYCVRRMEERSLRTRWRRFIYDANLRCALGTLVTQSEVSMLSTISKKAAMWFGLVALFATVLFSLEAEDRESGTFRVRPAQRQGVPAPLAAFVDSVYIHEGDRVECGMIVARLNLPELDSQIAQARGQVNEARAHLEMLQRGTRIEELAGQRRRVEHSRAWRNAVQQELHQAGEAFEHELASLTQLIDQHRALTDFAKVELDHDDHLRSTGAVTDEMYLRAKAKYEESLAKWKQAHADKLTRQSLGTTVTQTELARIERELADAEANLALMEAGSRQEAIDAARAVLEKHEAELDYLLDCQQRLDVVSPKAGIVVTPHMQDKVGQYLERGDPICEIADNSELSFEIAVPESAAERIQVGQQIELKVRALPYRVLHANVEQIAPLVRTEGTENQTASLVNRQQESSYSGPSEMIVYSRPETADSNLRPGMTGYSRIYTGRRSLGAIVLDRILRFLRTEFWW